MRYLKQLVYSIALSAIIGFTAEPVAAQQGQITTGGGVTTGSFGGTGGLAGGTGGGGLGGGGGGLGGGGGMAGGLSAMTLTGLEQPPQITAPGTTGASSTVIDASNFLANYYGNPLYQGILANAKSGVGPGGFGSPLFGTGTGGGGGQLGFAGGTTGARTTTGLGGRTGGRTGALGGFGGTGAGQNGIVVQLPVQISYPAVARFSAPPVPATQLQADISGKISRATGLLSNPAGVQVLTQGNVVILRGAVKDEDEARLLVNVVRLTPGVAGIQNELTFPKQ